MYPFIVCKLTINAFSQFHMDGISFHLPKLGFAFLKHESLRESLDVVSFYRSQYAYSAWQNTIYATYSVHDPMFF